MSCNLGNKASKHSFLK